jgi:hypothetical protein
MREYLIEETRGLYDWLALPRAGVRQGSAQRRITNAQVSPFSYALSAGLRRSALLWTRVPLRNPLT